MRRLSSLSRPFAAMFALWFAMVLGDPGVLHSCPMHGGHAAQTKGAPGHQQHAAAHERAASHDSSRMPAPTAPCTCVGHCCATPATAPLPTVPTFVVPAAVADETSLPELAGGELSASADVRLPFANGPP